MGIKMSEKMVEATQLKEKGNESFKLRKYQEAVDFYISTFEDSKINATLHYPKNEVEGLAEFQKDLAGKILTIDFDISG